MSSQNEIRNRVAVTEERAMTWSIEYRGAEGRAATEACRTAAQYQAAVQQLLAQHAEHGHVIESVHGEIRVRDRDGAPIATYWFVE